MKEVSTAITPPMLFFERLSCLYRAETMNPWWHWYSEDFGPRRALALFAGQYAYERQGRALSYPHAAYFAIASREDQAVDAAEVWRAFQRDLDGARLNLKNNPLAHTSPNCRCACCIFTGGDDRLVDIVEVARCELAEGHLRRAFDRLNRVRGVGPKIASFFLRDVAVWFKIEPVKDREILQPVDVWVQRYLPIPAGGAAGPTQSQTARWICENSAAPEAANQGLWYFGSQIAASEVKLRKALANEQYAYELVERYVDQLQSAVTAWRSPVYQPDHRVLAASGPSTGRATVNSVGGEELEPVKRPAGSS